MRLTACSYSILSLVLSVVCDAKGAAPLPKVRFETEPEYHAQFINISHAIIEPSLRSEGYLFITPPLSLLKGAGPQIYDTDGNLVWYGTNPADTSVLHAQDLHVCNYLGETGNHLCVHEEVMIKAEKPDSPQMHSQKVILDNSYSHVGMNYTYPDGKGKHGPNRHEFNVVDNGEAFLQPTYPRIPMDFSPYGGYGDAYVMDACFHEISVRSGKPNFEWCISDHIPQWREEILSHQENRTRRPPGMGLFSWDAFHLNSMDKNADGDYLLSFRHLDEIMKVAGIDNRHGVPPGTPLWRLGGYSNEFKMEDPPFMGQHDVRCISLSSTEEVFSILNNDYQQDRIQTGSHASSGQVIKINNATMTASMLRKYPSPSGQVTVSRGSFQSLPNGNVFIGWGSIPEVTEFLDNGTIVWHAIIQNKDPIPPFSYRALKSPWKGMPKWKPKIVAKTVNCRKGSRFPITAYVSWNGATEVVNWRFATAREENGDWNEVGMFKRIGFETKAVLSSGLDTARRDQPRYVSVEALDADGTVLGGASTTISASQEHDTEACTAKLGEDESATSSKSSSYVKYRGIPVLLFVLCLCEAFDWLLQRIC